MRITIFILVFAFSGISVYSQEMKVTKTGNKAVMSKEVLQDKIKGAWVAQTVGVTFGLPAEFNYNSTLIRNNQKLIWNDSSMLVEFRDRPGTYDDIYMDLSFMKVIEEQGVDAPAQAFAESFAYADYKLWFANQTARYNILNGLTPPESGHWLNNPCADDIDFQIEADFAGLMAPGMINSAVEICDKVGHIMNYGDGYYGGVFVAGLYSLALTSDNVEDIESIVKEAISVIPAESKFSQCINDVIQWHEDDPVDWQMTWFKTIRKWGVDIGSPLGVFEPFNIDAKINAAWVVMGLLYGNGDFTRTFEIATRCGDDADCNPATAGGVLAAIVGFRNIPDFWTQGLEDVENMPFMGTTISLMDAYDMSYRHAEQMILRNNGKIKNNRVEIQLQEPVAIPLEIAFEGHYPVARVFPEITNNEISFEFEGIGFALAGPPNIKDHGDRNHVFETEMYIDGELVETAKLPTATNQRRFTPFWKYQLPKGKHSVVIKIMNPVDYANIQLKYAIIYDDEPFEIEL
ncbi:MAG: ADP-ribosylglycohydrolase family protein [Bacteroidales bacterium]